MTLTLFRIIRMIVNTIITQGLPPTSDLTNQDAVRFYRIAVDIREVLVRNNIHE